MSEPAEAARAALQAWTDSLRSQVSAAAVDPAKVNEAELIPQLEELEREGLLAVRSAQAIRDLLRP